MTTELNSIKLSPKGQVTISSHARRQLGLKPETRLLEVVINNCLVLIPQDEVLSEILKKAQIGMRKAGMSATKLKAAINKRRTKNLSKHYPELFHA
jgi:bifunctional DNA-binding transcriptional regulator/antitoxin component of YhaV-PrlF toxin-antitoxin module